MHHIGIKIATRPGTLVVLVPGLGLLAYGLHDVVPAPVAAIALPVFLVGSLLLVQGQVGVRLEQHADDYAVSTVGSEPLRRALNKTAGLNMTKRALRGACGTHCSSTPASTHGWSGWAAPTAPRPAR